MENIVFSFQDIVTACTAITAIAAVVALIRNGYAEAQKPNKEQDARIDMIEKEISTIKASMNTDSLRIKTIEDGNRVTQKALLALMSHAINGNDIDKLNEAKTDLERYLVEK